MFIVKEFGASVTRLLNCNMFTIYCTYTTWVVPLALKIRGYDTMANDKSMKANKHIQYCIKSGNSFQDSYCLILGRTSITPTSIIFPKCCWTRSLCTVASPIFKLGYSTLTCNFLVWVKISSLLRLLLKWIITAKMRLSSTKQQLYCITVHIWRWEWLQQLLFFFFL